MGLHGVNKKMIGAIGESMNQLNMQLTACGTRLANIPLKSGIFQGDTLSTLLFCVTLSPLSIILNRTTLGYKLKSGQNLNHLLYMNDFEQYAKTENG